MKESEKRDKYLDLAWELKKTKLWNIKVTVIPVVVATLGTITEGLVKRQEDLEIRGRVETIQTMIKIGQNTKSQGNLKRLAVT